MCIHIALVLKTPVAKIRSRGNDQFDARENSSGLY